MRDKEIFGCVQPTFYLKGQNFQVTLVFNVFPLLLLFGTKESYWAQGYMQHSVSKCSIRSVKNLSFLTTIWGEIKGDSSLSII